MKKLAKWLIVCVLTGAILGCGGGSGTSPSSSAVMGVATPGAVSVVTAN